MQVTLPTPSPDAIAHSEQLRNLIHAEINKHDGWLSFTRFMELALYAPGFGYYTAGAHKFGESGDFTTAPELSALFGRTLARQAIEVMQQSEPHILELGAGSGKLALDILSELERLNHLPQRYNILEVSADLRERQRALLRERVPHLADRVHWLDTLPEKFSGFIVANEVLDALPVHLVHWRDSAITERGVALNPDCSLNSSPSRPPLIRGGADRVLPVKEGGSNEFSEISSANDFVWKDHSISDAALLQSAQQIGVPDGYVSEICLAARGLIQSLAQCLEQGAMLFIDYGFGAREYYHPQRNTGTLMCHYRHHAHDDPFYWPGLQDITAHVNFTDIAECGIDAGLELQGYTTQAFFLINSGITTLVANTSPENLREYLPLSAQLQKLTSPAEMGELFKVIAFGKKMATPLSGFAMGDLTRTL
ncbi:MAG: class I SAM-dependent methyltransferase [Gallionella sp.]|nr:class I SAM-dependent methyltransferase [Gallionella sp.]